MGLVYWYRSASLKKSIEVEGKKGEKVISFHRMREQEAD
jgi:hypothetical protein